VTPGTLEDDDDYYYLSGSSNAYLSGAGSTTYGSSSTSYLAGAPQPVYPTGSYSYQTTGAYSSSYPTTSTVRTEPVVVQPDYDAYEIKNIGYEYHTEEVLVEQPIINL